MTKPTQITIPFITIFLMVCVAFGTTQPQAAHAAAPSQTTGPNFAGVWVSAGCEPHPGGPYAKRELTIEARAYTYIITAFSDPKCWIPSLRMRIDGTITIRGSSVEAPTIYKLEFQWKTVTLRPEVTPMADFLNTSRQGLCGSAAWSPGGEQDLAATKGCRLLRIDLSRTNTEYDLGAVYDNQLLLGARPADGGTIFTPARRPTALGPALVRLQEVGAPTFAPAPPAPPPAPPTIILPETGGNNKKP
jgi:hypothetical protein